MTSKQMRELDAWIAEHVIGWQERQAFYGSAKKEGHSFWVCDGKAVTSHAAKGTHWFPSYTTDPAAAMSIQKSVAKYLKPLNDGIAICELGDGRIRITNVNTIRAKTATESETLELCICLFARALYEKDKG